MSLHKKSSKRNGVAVGDQLNGATKKLLPGKSLSIMVEVNIEKQKSFSITCRDEL